MKISEIITDKYKLRISPTVYYDLLADVVEIEEQEPCEDAVSRKAVINQIFYSTDNNGDVVLGSALRERIARLPSVTPQEPKTGHWIEEFNDLEGEVRFTCSSCGKYQLFGTDFCYHCGAKMIEPQESEDKEG
jgi:hypothetical protein